MTNEKKKFDFDAFKRVTKLAASRKYLFYSSLFVSVSLAIVSVYRPKLIQEVIDNDISKSNYPGLINGLTLLTIILLLEIILQFFQVFLANLISQDVIKKMRDRLFRKIIEFRLSFFDRTPNGVLVTRSVSDIETVAEVLNEGILVFLGDFVRIIAVIGMMFLMNWKLSVLVLLTLPLMIIVTRFFQQALKKVFTIERNLTAKLNSFVQERLSGMAEMQLFNRENAEYEKFKLINHELKEAHIKTIFYFSLLFPVVDVVSSISIMAVIVGSGIDAIYFKNVSSGEIFAFILFVQMLVRPLRQIAERFNSIQRGLIGADRVFKLMEEAETIPDKGVIKDVRLKGNISFQEVSFSYNGKEQVLKEISFNVKSGETVAIVGATGAGKSTIINLVNRFYDINAGTILLDDIPIQDYRIKTLRKNIATVMQDVFLFHGTIYENIVLGKNTIPIEKVKEAAKEIGINDFIESLPGNYLYKVSERGGDLSAGQRQLISFLRAYIYNPAILVLDEATSSIDTITEDLIQKATKKLTQNRTAIIIAHRLATIQNADRILVMDKGKIVETGTHNELVKAKGLYSKLYQAQFNSHLP